MTEQREQHGYPTTSEILAMDQAQFDAFQQRRAVIREIELEKAGVAPATPVVETPIQRAAKAVSDRPEGLYISKKTVRKGGLTIGGVGALIGTGLLAGAVLFGGGGEKSPVDTTGANPSSTPSGETSSSSEPSKAPEATPETSNFQPKETREGWERKTIELADGSKLDADSKEVKVGEEVEINAGTVISGDISIDGKFLSDSDALTGGLYINNKDGAKLKAPYNATAYENFDTSKLSSLVETIKIQMEETGCGLPEGCETVKPVVIEADGTTHEYDGTSASNAGSTPEATQAPTSETQHPEGCQCQVCCVVCEQPSATPAPTSTPEAVGCPEDTSDIEHNPTEWNGKGSPVEKHDGPAIFQADGTVIINGKKISKYDSDGSTAQIYVVDDKVDGNPVKYQYDQIYGDLQMFCPTLSKEQKNEVLQTDIEQTLARKGINLVRVTYIDANGKSHSEDIKG
jgi:hypothetical protein